MSKEGGVKFKVNKIPDDHLLQVKTKDSDNSAVKTQSDVALKKMVTITMICTLFLIAELVGGIMANSLAILTDAAHLCSDLSGFVISMIAIWIGRKKPNKKYTFGYYRAEVIGALVSVITIWILTGILLKEAIDRFINPSEICAHVMLITAIFGLICNLLMMKVLHGGHGHGHGGCSHGHGHEIDHDHGHHFNLNEDVDMSHMELEDYSVHETDEEVSSKEKEGKSLHLIENINEDFGKLSHEGHVNEHKENEEHNHDHEHNQEHDHDHDHDHEHDHEHEHNHSHSSKKCEHNHSHDHSHNPTHDHSTHDHPHDHHEENVNIKAAIIHIIGDIIQSVGVVIAALLIVYDPKWVIVDPICTLVFSVIVMFTTVNITKQCINILMEASPKKFDADEIEKQIKNKFVFIKSIHSLNIWSLSSGKNCISLHAVVDDKINLFKVRTHLHKTYKFENITIQFETKEESTRLKCSERM